jgi:hypothetical protein
MKVTAKGIAAIVLLCSPIFSYAHTWPIFSVPNATEIHLKIVRGDCPLGEGKMPLGTQFSFKVFHDFWYWMYTGSEACQKIPARWHYLAYEQTGNYSGDKIILYYGGTEKLFRFTLTIPPCPGENFCKWYCAPMSRDNPPHVFSCAYDE